MALGRDLAQVAAGPLAAVINALGAKKQAKWRIESVEDGEKVEGQFGPVEMSEEATTTYVEHTPLNRQHPITMWSHGDTVPLSFGARLYAVHAGDTIPADKLAKLKEWVKRDPDLARPHLVALFVGERLMISRATMTLTGIVYDEAHIDGSIRGVTFTVNLREHYEFTLDSAPPPETRYHRASTGDYYELLAWFEYRNPALGDVVRKRHPDKLLLTEGEIVKLPSAAAIRSEIIKPTSIPLRNTLKREDSVEKRLKQDVLDRNNRSMYSPIVPEGL